MRAPVLTAPRPPHGLVPADLERNDVTPAELEVRELRLPAGHVAGDDAPIEVRGALAQVGSARYAVGA